MREGALLYRLYAALNSVLYAIGWPVLADLGLLPGDEGRGWRERMGRLPGSFPRGRVWIHAASVGEITALEPFIRETRRIAPRIKLALSVMTPAGRRRARELYGLPVAFAPLDAPVPARRWVRRAAPRALIVMETELWPVWLSEVAAWGAPLSWINGRLSDHSFPRYRIIRPLIARTFSRFRLLGVITGLDAARAAFLGAPRKRIRVCGNLKVDGMVPAAPPAGVPRGPWIVAGSTRNGEESALLWALRAIRRRCPAALLLIAPRHLNRVPAVDRLARRRGFTVARRSGGYRGEDVLVLDTIGELARFYRIASAAFVGGTLVPVGGHNLLEPALAGVPVVFGPHTANVRDAALGLRRAGGGFPVPSPAALARRLTQLLAAPVFARRAGARARAYAMGLKGVSRRVALMVVREGLP